MTRSSHERAREALQAETGSLLIGRLRICMGLSLGMVLVWGAADSFIISFSDPVFLFYPLQALVFGTALVALRGPEAERRAIPLGVLLMGEICIITAGSGVLSDDLLTGPLVYIIVTMATATLFPWGVGPQVALVGIAGGSAAWTSLAGLHLVDATVVYALLAMVVAMVTSVYVAYEFDRYRTRSRIAEEELRGSAVQLGQAQAVAQLGSLEWNPETDEMSWSDELYRLGGVDPETFQPSFEAAVGTLIHPEERQRVTETVRQGVAEQEGFDVTFRIVRPDGAERIVAARASVLANPAGGSPRVVATCQDVTDRVRLEEQLRQSQKMEAVGRLAGGVAHDFNNLLTIIKSSASLVASALNPDSEAREDVRAIDSAATRASDLTRQLLAFARRQGTEERVLEVDRVLQNLKDLLRRLVGEDIEIEIRVVEGIDRIAMDPGELEQVIVNLVANARDAMPDGGTVGLEAENAPVGEGHPALEPGRYVKLVVRDTGSGMPEDVRKRVFEPFFTTKEVGKGTGLGLATSYGIVKHRGGDIVLESEPEKGTVVQVFLPSAGRAEAEAPRTAPPEAARERNVDGGERVLVVEDEPLVRNLTVRVLKRYGYDVLAAQSGEEALRVAEENTGDPIQLLVTDVVMPGLRGPEVARRLRTFYPSVRVLLMSGYAGDQVGVEYGGVPFLAKPFTPDGLVDKVREVLGSGSMEEART